MRSASQSSMAGIQVSMLCGLWQRFALMPIRQVTDRVGRSLRFPLGSVGSPG